MIANIGVKYGYEKMGHLAFSTQKFIHYFQWTAVLINGTKPLLMGTICEKFNKIFAICPLIVSFKYSAACVASGRMLKYLLNYITQEICNLCLKWHCDAKKNYLKIYSFNPSTLNAPDKHIDISINISMSILKCLHNRYRHCLFIDQIQTDKYNWIA